MSDIPDLTIGKFAAYFLPIAMIYFCSWIIFSWLGLKKQKSANYWLILVICGVVAPYLIYLPFYKTPYMYSDSFYHFSFVRSIAEGNFLQDAVYTGYPTYYPPLYSLLLGFLLWFFKASVLSFFIYIPIFNILLICFLAYFVGQYVIDRMTGVLYILMLFVFSVPATSYLIGGTRVSAGLHSAIGKLWINIFPHKPLTVKPAETRMGKGKGNPEKWVAVVKPGRVMFELSGITEEMANEAFELARHKLPIKSRIIKRAAL